VAGAGEGCAEGAAGASGAEEVEEAVHASISRSVGRWRKGARAASSSSS